MLGLALLHSRSAKKLPVHSSHTRQRANSISRKMLPTKMKICFVAFTNVMKGLSKSFYTQLAAIIVFIWLLGFGFQWGLPMVQNGASLVTIAKLERMDESGFFREDADYRIVFCGNSKMLSGFRPESFSLDLPTSNEGNVDAVNIGFPADSELLSKLRRLLSSGNQPTHVVMSQGWLDEKEKPGGLSWITNDRKVVDALVPWRRLPRDLTVFGIRAAKRRNPIELYRKQSAEIDLMLESRGYYFIESQSRHEGNRLPDSFEIPTDDPKAQWVRLINPESWEFRELERLRKEHQFEIWIAPTYYRVGQYAPAIENKHAKRLSEFPGWRVLGPDYWLYPPSFFSDPVHLNPYGAEQYTEDLSLLISEAMREDNAL